MDTDPFAPSDRVLVAVMNNPRDFGIAQEEGWYRVPVRHAPRSATEANVLAFYFTKAFGDDRWAIHWYGPVRGHELVRRRDILPEETNHPRADEVYYQLQLGPLARLDTPIPSLRWRRITFLETTWDRFTAAEEINDLYVSGADGLYVTLKDDGFCVEREYAVYDTGVEYTVDLAIPCRDGTLAIVSGDRSAPPGALRDPDLESVRKAVARLGGETRGAG
ncbi:MAG: hypothetical protein GX620_03455 [Chloroflexi bacterium]|nr:hypothetical protein [Chloroflexota bacterium]